MHFSLHFIFLTAPLLILTATGEVVKNFQPCVTRNNCEVSQLRITPCPEATLAKPKPCVMKKGRNATIEFDYVAKAGLDDLTTGAYSSSIVDLPLEGMDKVGCHHTSCPTTGQQQTYNYVLKMQEYFPSANYKVKWRLSKAEELECCFTFRIKVES